MRLCKTALKSDLLAQQICIFALEQRLIRETAAAPIDWGLLGPELLASERRTRTLGLGAAVRQFNDLAVPGLGGIWFGKQVFLATLGVAIAESMNNSGRRAQNIEVSNAVEALGCWLALDKTGWNRDPRLRGATKMRGITDSDLVFANMRKPSFYVTQPMRQATVQPLLALGFVESTGERFNSFVCTKNGHDFIESVCAKFGPYNRSVKEHLLRWAKGEHNNVGRSAQLTEALSPLTAMSTHAREFLRERIVQGADVGAMRRRRALEWVEQVRTSPQRNTSWKQKPATLDDDHWRDMYAGALFFRTRDAAITLMDSVESEIASARDQCFSLDAPFPKNVTAKREELFVFARKFLEFEYDPSPGFTAGIFCRECTASNSSQVLEKLTGREGRVLQQRGRYIVPGVAFRGRPVDETDTVRSPEDAGQEKPIEQMIPLPDGISNRVKNLFLLNLDLSDSLNEWLSRSAASEQVNDE